MLPRFLTSNSTKSSCSRDRRPIQPKLNCPSITIPLWGDSSRVTINSFPLTGSLVIIGCMLSSSYLRIQQLKQFIVNDLIIITNSIEIIADENKNVNNNGNLNH